jgi:hypothetical protein
MVFKARKASIRLKFRKPFKGSSRMNENLEEKSQKVIFQLAQVIDGYLSPPYRLSFAVPSGCSCVHSTYSTEKPHPHGVDVEY